MIGKKQSFTDWLQARREEDTRVGDLARDMLQDRQWPKQANTHKTFKRHLEEKCACDGALDALNEAWTCYQHTGGTQ
jgi:uncharacterized protein YozE (UPF0346 family)